MMISGVNVSSPRYTGKCYRCNQPITDYFVQVNRIDKEMKCIIQEFWHASCVAKEGMKDKVTNEK
jgi:hypothetical protein